MAKYRVLGPVKTAAGIVTEGYVDIDDGEVAELVALGVIGEAEDAQSREAAIVTAIGQLDKENADLWLRDGMPVTDAVAAITGFSVSAAERNAAWQKLNSGA